MLIGNMRVSNADGSQVLDLQRDALIAAGVKRPPLYEDKASGEKDDRSPVWRPASRHCARVILSSSGSSIASAATSVTSSTPSMI